MTALFSKALVQLRKDAGFATAYQFYHNNGGARVLRMSYRNYLIIEQGRTLPPLERLKTFILALRLVPGSAEANAFVSAWLKTLAGPEDFRSLIEPLTAAGPGGTQRSPMHKLMKKTTDAKKYYLTVEQTEVIYAAPENHLCFLALTSDADAWKVKDFADRLGLKEAAAEKALKALAAAKLAKEVKKRVYRRPLQDTLWEYPHMGALPPELVKKIHACDEKLAADGRKAFLRQVIVRADETNFRNFFPLVDVNISTADAYAISERTEKSALFMVEGRIIKLRDF